MRLCAAARLRHSRKRAAQHLVEWVGASPVCPALHETSAAHCLRHRTEQSWLLRYGLVC